MWFIVRKPIQFLVKENYTSNFIIVLIWFSALIYFKIFIISGISPILIVARPNLRERENEQAVRLRL